MSNLLQNIDLKIKDGDYTDMLENITIYLKDVGFRINLRGFNYTRDAILLRIQDKFLTATAKEIYKEIAEKYDVTRVAVERAVRYSIESAWMNELADHSRNPYCPSSAEFIAESAEAVLKNIKKDYLETYSAKKMFGRPSIFKDKSLI